LPLDPRQSGIIVLFSRGQRWLRGYGLTAHPNLLGAMITAILLLLLPALKRSLGRNRVLLAIAYTGGLVGLLVSFSRASTLAYIAGLITWLILEGKREGRSWSISGLKQVIRSPIFLLAAVILIVVLFVIGDLALSRVTDLDSEVEAISINQRLSDWRLALTLISQNPIRGTGLGQYIIAAQTINPLAVNVHNIPLLVTAELGIGGLLIFLWLAVSGLRSRVDALAPWIAVLIIGLFDLTLWLTGNWQTSVIFAFIVANLSQDILASRK
jgi:O-antigen ligase